MGRFEVVGEHQLHLRGISKGFNQARRYVRRKQTSTLISAVVIFNNLEYREKAERVWVGYCLVFFVFDTLYFNQGDRGFGPLQLDKSKIFIQMDCVKNSLVYCVDLCEDFALPSMEFLSTVMVFLSNSATPTSSLSLSASSTLMR